MPFCQECGKEVQKEWNNCPHCSSILLFPEQKELNTNNEQAQVELSEDNIGPVKSIFLIYKQIDEKIGTWAKENKLKAGLILAIILLAPVAIVLFGEDEGIVVEYTVTNYNCSDVEVQYVDSNEDVKIVRNLAEGDTFEIEASGFESGDLVMVSGINRGSGYCTIIVNMYAMMYVDLQRHDTAGQGEAISVASVL